MGDVNRGRELFTNRLEYPLPKRTGTKDYVFYFVPRGDPFRDAGNAFFKKFYANHIALDVRTLEELIDALADAVDGGVTHIREIVILSHGAALGLLFPIVNGVTKTNLREYKYLTAFSLTCLQKDVEAGKFSTLNNKRQKVIARLREDSWVTIRACNFGRSVPGMYALYAFFGGKANVYAPMLYQFFGTPPIYEGMRLDTRLRAHEHLIKQHFFPKHVHTRERTDTILTAIVDRAKFSEPFVIASMRQGRRLRWRGGRRAHHLGHSRPEAVQDPARIADDARRSSSPHHHGVQRLRHRARPDLGPIRSARPYRHRSDCPGTELAAYLDRLSLDDLLSVLEYLRSPFKPVNAYYIQHVQEALARKKGFQTWLRDNAPITADSVLPLDPYRALSRSEDQSYTELSYSFEFNSVWAEVKASNPSKTTITNDLYLEESLAETFKIPEPALIDRRELPQLDSDSPGADIEALRVLESVGFEPFFKADKGIVEHAPQPTSLDCAEFEEIVEKWQEVKDLEPEGMREVLEALKTKSGKSYWDVLDDFKSHVKAWFEIVGIKIPGIDYLVMSKKDFAELVLKKAPYLSRIVVLQAILEAEFVFTIPLAMWLDFAEAQVESRFYWYTVGRITVMRQWLRELEDLTFRKEIDSPSDINIDVTIPLSDEPYYISRYNFERVKSRKFLDRFVTAPDRLKDGFDDQTRVIHRLGEEILSMTDEILGDALRDSGLSACQQEVLRQAGIFDLREHKSFVIRQLANELLAKLPTV